MSALSMAESLHQLDLLVGEWFHLQAADSDNTDGLVLPKQWHSEDSPVTMRRVTALGDVAARIGPVGYSVLRDVLPGRCRPWLDPRCRSSLQFCDDARRYFRVEIAFHDTASLLRSGRVSPNGRTSLQRRAVFQRGWRALAPHPTLDRPGAFRARRRGLEISRTPKTVRCSLSCLAGTELRSAG
jgi:hypothetical protein